MTAEAQMNLIVLYEDEIRIAARALNAVDAAFRDNVLNTDPERMRVLIAEALAACGVALGGAHLDDVTLVLSSKTALIRNVKDATS